LWRDNSFELIYEAFHKKSTANEENEARSGIEMVAVDNEVLEEGSVS